MIIANGHIQFKVKALPVVGTDGWVIAPGSATWGEAIPCQWTPSSANTLQAVVEGEHITKVSFTILVEDDIQIGSQEQVLLTDCNGTPLGEYSVISFEHLAAVGQVRIIV